jgi:hypothetical protein
VLQINLVPFGATSTPLLQSVTVTEIRATTVTINVYLTVTLVYSITVTIPDDSGTVTVYVSPESKLPIEASIVEIVLGEPKDPYETMYDTTVTLVGCFEPLAATTTPAATSTPAGTTASTSTPPTTTIAATAAATTTMTLATVTTSATTSGTTTTVLCPIQDLMDKDGSKPFIPVDKVSVTKDDSCVEFQKYDGKTTPWIVSLPDDDSKQKPTMTIDLIGAGGQPAPEVTSVALSPDSNAQVVTVTITSTANEVTTYPRLQVNREGQILFSAPFVIRAILVIIVLEEPVDASMGVYTVSPNVQGCFRAEMTTIVTPTTIAAGTTTPSTTTVSSLSTTGTVVTTTTPTVTTTLSATAPPTDGSTHVTTAVVTTTITATGTTTVVCPLTGEMPKQTPDFN